MSNAKNAPKAAEEFPNSSWSPEAVRAAGIEGLAQLLGDVGHLLEELAKDPGDLFETRGMARSSAVNLMHAEQVIRGAQDALEARTVVALSDVTRRDRTDAARDEAAHEGSAVPSAKVLGEQAHEIAREDHSLITRCSPSASGSSLASARRLVSSMPTMFTALATRKVSAQAAYAVSGATSVLDDDQRREVDAILGERLPYLDAAGIRDWRAEVATAITELDPEGAVVRHQKARKERSVTLTPGQHGMANLTAHVPAIDAALMHKRISLEAERRRAEGADEGHGALAADALVDTVLGRDDAMDSVELDVGVIITDRALFRPDAADAAQITGYGPVPAEAVRAQLRAATAPPTDDDQDPLGTDGPQARAVIRRLYTHPTTGELVAVESRARAFPPAMARFLTWRDTSCRGPFCNAQSRQSDHITPHARGGPTTVDNGQDTCGHCNQKEGSTLLVERRDDPERPGHRVAWTGHSGVTRVTAPRPLVTPERWAGNAPERAGDGDGDGSDRAGDSVGPDSDIRSDSDDGPDNRAAIDDRHDVDGPGDEADADGASGADDRPEPESGAGSTGRPPRSTRRTTADRERARRLLTDRRKRRGSARGGERTSGTASRTAPAADGSGHPGVAAPRGRIVRRRRAPTRQDADDDER